MKLLLAVYNLLFAVLLAPVSVLLLVFSSKYRKEIFYKLPERFGFAFRNFKKDSSKKTVWVHCASLGEARAAEPVINALKDDYFVILTVLTKTGREYAQKIDKLRFVSLLPFDIYPLMLRAFKIVRPDIFVIVETEIWPSMLCAAKKCAVKIMTINGRMSEKSFNFYGKTKFFWKPFISLIDIISARNPADAKRFASLIGGGKKVSVSGNIKYDRDFKTDAKRSDYGLKDDDFVFTAGSSRVEETRIIADSYNKVKSKLPGIKFLLAPRQLSRLDEVKKILNQNKIVFSLFSQIQSLRLRQCASDGNSCAGGDFAGALPQSRFIIVDVFGKLQSAYALSDVSFVGGSLVNKGGQNPIEPAAYGKPALFGKYMDNFESEAEILLKSGGAFQVSDAADLAEKIIGLISDKDAAKAAGQRAMKAVESQKGAVKTVIEQVKSAVENNNSLKI
jgi:3-deoxy-D-manno-octulosonic-acid transferase